MRHIEHYQRQGHPVAAPYVMLDNLQTWRRRRGMSQAQLAVKAGITQAGISQLERGLREPTLRTVHKLAVALEIDPALLLRSHAASLSRETSDRVARSIVLGRPAGSAEERRLTHVVGSLVIQKLRAHHAPGRRQYARSRWAVAHRPEWIRRTYGPQVPTQILRRIDTLLSAGRFDEAR